MEKGKKKKNLEGVIGKERQKFGRFFHLMPVDRNY